MKGSTVLTLILFLLIALVLIGATVLIDREREVIRQNRETEKRLNEEVIKNIDRRGF